MTRKSRVVVALTVAGLVLTACTGPTGSSAATSSPSLPTSSTTTPATTAVTTSTPVTATPHAGDCYQLAFSDLDQPTNASPVVDCTQHHTAVTIAVLRHQNTEDVSGISDACTKAVRTRIGATKLQLATTMVRAVWFLPESPTQHWARCDLVLYESAGSLAPLPQRTRNLFKHDPISVGTCSVTAPGTKKFDRVLCAAGTPWRVLVALPVSGKSYPGVKTLRTQADYRCADAVRLAKNLPLTYTYGYEWPTKDQWNSGNHNLLCWGKD